MQDVSEKVQQLARLVDISKMSYREIGRRISRSGEEPVHPQTIKNALAKLDFDRDRPSEALPLAARLISIPVLGVANAGPATHIVGSTDRGSIKVSVSLLPGSNYKDFYALEVDGNSMNKATIRGNTIENGAYVIIDNSKKTPREGDVVAVVYDGLANIKKVHFDYKNELIVLHSESSDDFEPIVINPQDNWEGLIGGSVIHVVKKPSLATIV